MLNTDGPVMMDDPAYTYESGTTPSSMLCEEHCGRWARKLKNHQRTVCCALRSKDADSRVGSNAKRSPNSYMRLKMTGWPDFKRVDSINDTHEQLDVSNNGDVTDEEEEGGSTLKAPTPKDLILERKHWKKLNERLYSFRALPGITKMLTFAIHSGEEMDKASFLSDAIRYGPNLQNQLDKLQEDIADLETHKEDLAVAGSGDEDPNRNNSVVDCQKKSELEHRIVELEVSQMEPHIYHVRIYCKKTPGVLVQLTRAIEASELEILNATISSVDDNILNTVVVEVKNGVVMKTEELRNMARALFPKFGFCLC